ncbi:hypothetical protein C1645_834649 [Glomus cerebriforme]|uniref:Uncharacterized protein n=1 Tax=Glomus cerebriforme TaxID=658196 RepID=A0A397SFZ2_9GLOM|nr:hypothetical protein C1645_834649 [Glomus cerebriforme]
MGKPYGQNIHSHPPPPAKSSTYYYLVNFLPKRTTLKDNHIKNLPELLSKVAEIIPLMEDNIFLNLLVESVATILLNIIELGRLSATGFQYLLSYKYEKEKPFITP